MQLSFQEYRVVCASRNASCSKDRDFFHYLRLLLSEEREERLLELRVVPVEELLRVELEPLLTCGVRLLVRVDVLLPLRVELLRLLSVRLPEAERVVFRVRVVVAEEREEELLLRDETELRADEERRVATDEGRCLVFSRTFTLPKSERR